MFRDYFRMSLDIHGDAVLEELEENLYEILCDYFASEYFAAGASELRNGGSSQISDHPCDIMYAMLCEDWRLSVFDSTTNTVCSYIRLIARDLAEAAVGGDTEWLESLINQTARRLLGVAQSAMDAQGFIEDMDRSDAAFKVLNRGWLGFGVAKKQLKNELKSLFKALGYL